MTYDLHENRFMNEKFLKERIVAAAKSAFSSVVSENPGVEFCCFSLYSDPDARTVCPSMNSRDNLEKAKNSDPNDFVYYKWSPAEWDHEYDGAEFFSDICEYLSDEADKIVGDQQRILFRENVFECCVSSLEQLRIEGFFTEKLVEPNVVVFSISDGSNKKEKEWISRINSEENSREFSEWIEAINN